MLQGERPGGTGPIPGLPLLFMNTAGLFYLLFVIMFVIMFVRMFVSMSVIVIMRVLMWVRMRMFVSMLVVVVVVSNTGMSSLQKDTLENVYEVGFVVPDSVPCPLDHSGGNGPKTVDEHL
jgi:hypothetical protein